MLNVPALMAENLVSPPVLFFLLGTTAALLKSDLSFPRELSSALALYLMMAIGFRGGAELAHAGLSEQVVQTALAALVLGFLLPGIAFLILTRLGRLDPVNAGAIAAHYGSISAVTFITTTNFLTFLGVGYESYMVAMMALMEAPGIVSGILLARAFSTQPDRAVTNRTVFLRSLVREALFGGSVIVLLGSFAIGILTGKEGTELLKPFVHDLFPGALALFLLDMGLTAARRLGDFIRLGRFLLGFGVVMPLIGGSLGVLGGRLVGLSPGGATLLAVLAASASYIAAPAAVRLALPGANPSLSITLALGVTFPFNVLVGIPVYYTLARLLLPS
ncbi:sodium-dependent bicarbonate transport family permease [Caldinitratiruptor microaerophilus]|uniref:Sodium-dependent bicarbonate transport family permease n=1 Tax=Caldinitratiruptor microaerophilus TaxID=671077 RepID=A0AA35CLW6_9FIRM|nr:sodium-dependent bicarbonate transport family permease [Caldinitratiruptor microaerophilus]BDG59726.1 sodium-dependent bicarbonate transport family permease [Caldinitratiruptor microaerophilus]